MSVSCSTVTAVTSARMRPSASNVAVLQAIRSRATTEHAQVCVQNYLKWLRELKCLVCDFYGEFLNMLKLHGKKCNVIITLISMCFSKPLLYVVSSSFATDIDECETQYPCSQYCENHPGTFRCKCAKGYSLEYDRSSCKADVCKYMACFWFFSLHPASCMYQSLLLFLFKVE